MNVLNGIDTGRNGLTSLRICIEFINKLTIISVVSIVSSLLCFVIAMCLDRCVQKEQRFLRLASLTPSSKRIQSQTS